MNPRVTLENFDSVAVITMNRPEVRNAMDTPMLAALVQELRVAASDPQYTSVVITGAQGTFSAGADVSEEVDRDGAVIRMRLFTNLYELVTAFPKPSIAAVAGHCIGGGAEVAAGCDLRIGTDSARIRFPGAQFGIPIGAARLPLLIGLSHAKDLLLTTRTVAGQEAFRIGFLNRLVDERSLLQQAVELAATIANNPGSSVQKRLLDEAQGLRRRVLQENRGLVRWQEDLS